ncbi:MAG: DHHA1 domain-containing protein [Methylomonas sp.]|jgi:single-stranded DNA-specific DHH superfamily exonuclease
MRFDVFNGDADGICALIQLRCAFPADAQLITGVKREIALLDRVRANAGDYLTVLDVSLDTNRRALLNLLENGAEVFYADHHFAGELPRHPRLTSIIDISANTCTSLLINEYLQGRFAAWAVVGAFGDNQEAGAQRAAKPLQMDGAELEQLQRLGVCINYNAYGETVDDLQIAPEDLYRQLSAYRSPLDFIAGQPAVYSKLLTAYADDMGLAGSTPAEYQNQAVAVFVLPDEKWARRVSGVWANELANQYPQRAHAVLSPNRQGGLQVSVRAPLSNKTGADELCRQFPGGGGRKAAAGINHLEYGQLPAFINAFKLQYG